MSDAISMIDAISLSLLPFIFCRARASFNGERESNLLTITGDISQDHKMASKAHFMSHLGYGSYGSGGGVTGPGTGSGIGLNVVDDEETPRDKRSERKSEYGGSMGPLLNGAWAYEH